jgi:S-(hydroxymethyl)glutathione dehydrogenase/alcohol dehydrogenase
VSTKARAAVVDSATSGVAITDIELADLRPDEVLVRVVSTGVCHTDVAWADGALFDAFPVVHGHESAGVVEAVGSSVSRVAPGDRVAVALAHQCGQCRYCESGRPMLCSQRMDDPGRLSRKGAPLIQGFGTGGFAELAIVRETSAIPLPAHVPLDVAAVVGCATSTGLGSVFNIADVQYGSTVAILGAGGVGLNVLMGCVIAGAERIVVADPRPERRALATELGATDVVEPTESALREIAADGYEYVFESAGLPAPMELAIGITERGGTCTLIGAPPPDAEIRINALQFVPSQKRILGCLTGNVRPHVDFDRYFRLYARGRLPLDRLITGSVRLDDIDEGFRRNRDAEGIRTVVRITDE